MQRKRLCLIKFLSLINFDIKKKFLCSWYPYPYNPFVWLLILEGSKILEIVGNLRKLYLLSLLDCKVRFVDLYYDLDTFKLDVVVVITLSAISLIAPFKFGSIPYRVLYTGNH